MTEEELFELWKEMRKQRVDEHLRPPYEPSPMEFAKRVAEIAYSRGFTSGCYEQAKHYMIKNGIGDPQ